MKRQKHVNNDITKLEETKRLTQRNETLDQNNHELIEEPSTVKLRIVAGSRIQAGPRIQAGGSIELYQ